MVLNVYGQLPGAQDQASLYILILIVVVEIGKYRVAVLSKIFPAEIEQIYR